MNTFKLTLAKPSWWRDSYPEWSDVESAIQAEYPLPNEPAFTGDTLDTIWCHDDLKRIATMVLDRTGCVSLERIGKLRMVEERTAEPDVHPLFYDILKYYSSPL